MGAASVDPARLARQNLSVLPGGRAAPTADDDDRKLRRRAARVNRRPGRAEIEQILKRVSDLRGVRDQWESMLEEAYELFLPQRNPFFSGNRRGGQADGAAGQKKNRHVLDSTPALALKKWAARKQNALLPPNRKFFKLKAGIGTPEAIAEQADVLLESQTNIVFQELNASNFATEAHEAILDAGISTGALTIRDSGRENALLFTAVPADQVLFEEGPFGTIENMYREREVPARILAREYPGFEFSEAVQRERQKNPNIKVKVVECTVRHPIEDDYDTSVIEVDERHLGWHEIDDDSPWIVFGTLKLSGETYRRGPVLDALPDARTLNRVKELILRNAALAVAGVYTATDDGVLNPWTVSLQPGAIIPTAVHDSLKALETSHNFAISDLIVKDLQNSIMATMEALDLGRIEDTPVRTFGEMAIREKEAAIDSGSSAARLQTELVGQVIQKATRVLQKRGRVAEFKVDGRDVKVEFAGPLARAQDNEELLSIQAALELITPLGPGVMQIVANPEVLGRMIFEKSGVPAEGFKTTDEIATLKAQLEQAVKQGVKSGDVGLGQAAQLAGAVA